MKSSSLDIIMSWGQRRGPSYDEGIYKVQTTCRAIQDQPQRPLRTTAPKPTQTTAPTHTYYTSPLKTMDGPPASIGILSRPHHSAPHPLPRMYCTPTLSRLTPGHLPATPASPCICTSAQGARIGCMTRREMHARCKMRACLSANVSCQRAACEWWARMFLLGGRRVGLRRLPCACRQACDTTHDAKREEGHGTGRWRKQGRGRIVQFGDWRSAARRGGNCVTDY